jgi:hypothetical protein
MPDRGLIAGIIRRGVESANSIPVVRHGMIDRKDLDLLPCGLSRYLRDVRNDWRYCRIFDILAGPDSRRVRFDYGFDERR